jgi:UDPglucose 6-dehydrogenase
MEQAKPLMPNVTFCDDPYVCAQGAAAPVIATEWDAFRSVALDRLKKEIGVPVMVDLRNVYRPEELRRRGFQYTSIGRA